MVILSSLPKTPLPSRRSALLAERDPDAHTWNPERLVTGWDQIQVCIYVLYRNVSINQSTNQYHVCRVFCHFMKYFLVVLICILCFFQMQPARVVNSWRSRSQAWSISTNPYRIHGWIFSFKEMLNWFPDNGIKCKCTQNKIVIRISKGLICTFRSKTDPMTQGKYNDRQAWE